MTRYIPTRPEVRDRYAHEKPEQFFVCAYEDARNLKRMGVALLRKGNPNGHRFIQEAHQLLKEANVVLMWYAHQKRAA